MRAVIFANGDLGDLRAARALLQDGDLLLAADGGALHCLRLGLTPHILVGDYDSLDEDAVKAFAGAGAEVMRFPAEKDQTDLALAVALALERQADDLVILGALGTRWDQSLANLLLLSAPELAGVRVRLVDGSQEARLVRGGESLDVRGDPGDTVSLLALSETAAGISTTGLAYPLRDGVLKRGETRGVSNHMVAGEAQIHLRRGLLMCIQIRGPVEALEQE